jgi:hypothetical protein
LRFLFLFFLRFVLFFLLLRQLFADGPSLIWREIDKVSIAKVVALWLNHRARARSVEDDLKLILMTVVSAMWIYTNNFFLIRGRVIMRSDGCTHESFGV